jgi:adenosylmethionine---8-amino-7-oxononanoate aminotransferase
MAVGERSIFTAPFVDYLFQVEFIDFPTSENQESVVNQFQKLLTSGEVGAFIFEPLIQGASGMRMYSADVLDKLIAFAQQQDVVCIADEVFTGFYRTGKFLATDHLKNKADIIALSKGLTGGALPMGVTACTKKIYEAFLSEDITKAFLHGHSYTANPLACAAANASFDLLIDPETISQIKMIALAHQKFTELVRPHKQVKDVRSLGTVLAIEISSSGKTTYTDSLRTKILEYFLTRNILLRPLGNIMYVVPPYVITKEELDHVHQTMLKFLNSL